MTTADLVLAAIAVGATLVNIGWTVWFQQRERAERRRNQEEERELAEHRFRLQGAVIDIRPSQLFDVDRVEWAQIEVRNVGRGPCTVREIRLEVRDGGPTYIVYDRDNEPEEDHGPPLPHLLDGGRAAIWHVRADYIRDRDGRDGMLGVQLDHGELHYAPVSINLAGAE